MSHTLTWDHFFLSFAQYFNNLRQEAPPQADTVYRLRPGYHKGVSPQELEGTINFGKPYQQLKHVCFQDSKQYCY